MLTNCSATNTSPPRPPLGPVLDIDWLSEKIFASCSMDKKVLVCEVGKEEPLHQVAEHEV